MLPRVFLDREGLLCFLGVVLLAESAQNPLKNGFGDAWVIGNIYKKS